MNTNNVLGLIYADSYSSVISEITALRTMGSVPFGGRYRLIDFPLSNMVNCGIHKVGVITKSNFRSLMDHIGNGKPWDLSRKNEGLFLLPPFSGSKGVYSGRIDALSSIMDFVRKSSEEYVVISDCNFICNVDLGKMVKKHIDTNADITIAYKTGRIPDLDHLMLFDIADDGVITDVAVPPVRSGEGSYSANIIVINKSLLERLITEAVSYEHGSFEKDIIARNVKRLKIFGYKLEGFSFAIDSLQSYFNANMALLNRDNLRDLFKSGSPVYTKTADDMPAIYGIGSDVKDSLIADGCKIEGEVSGSVLFRGVHVAKGAIVRNSIIMQSAYIGEDAVLNCVIMDKNGVVTPRKSLSGAETYPVYIGKNIVI